MDPQEKQDARRSDAARTIWETSHHDEGTISAMGADVIAEALDDTGILTDPCKCGPWHPNMDGPSEECPRHGRPYEYWVEGCTVMSQRVSLIRELHKPVEAIKMDVSSPEGQEVLVCNVCAPKEYPCETVKILDGE